MQSPTEKKQGVYTYPSQWPVYSLAWSVRGDKNARLAIGSFLEDYSNKVELVQFSHDTFDFSTDNRLVFDHPYSPTNLMFFPSEDTTNPDIIATSGDYLRLWGIHEDRIELKALLNGNKTSEFNSAITSFDWAECDTRHIATSSVDTTCTIWDVETETVDSQLVAHDKEVYDISWGGFNVFASVSGDGSVRADPRFIATVGMDSNRVVILDIRFPTSPLMELNKHKGSVNAVSWAPRIGRQLCTVGDDSRALIWEVVGQGFRSEINGDLEPEMWYGSTAEINQARWSPLEMDWIAIAFLNKLQLLKV
uniref:Uncharacterized protein n=1 Tax=Quercus lobata TaxID=97700 RepID=A0A7N2M4K6_QUELO